MTLMPERLLISGDHKSASEHEQAAEELLGAATTVLHGGQSRKRIAHATVLAQIAQGHAILAALKNGDHPNQT